MSELRKDPQRDKQSWASQDSAICLLEIDGNGSAVFLSDGWPLICPGCGGGSPPVHAVGTNYLDSLQRCAETGDALCAQLYAGISAVLRNDLPYYAREFACPVEPDSGSLFWVAPRSQPGAGAFVVHVDLTKSKREKRSIELQAARYQGAAHAAGVSVFELDIATQSLKTDVDLCQRLGFERGGDFLTFPDWVSRLHGDDVLRVLETETNLLAPGAARDAAGNTAGSLLEVRLLRRDGSVCWVHVRSILERGPDDAALRIVGTITDVTASKIANNELQSTNAQLEDLAGRLITAREEERSRIARNLHDNLSQELAFVRISIGKLEPFLRSGPPAWSLNTIADQLARLNEQMGRVIEQVRELSHEIHPVVLEQTGLVPALRSLMRSGGSAVSFTLEADDIPEPIPPDIATCFYRVAQEAMQNVVNHSRSPTAVVTLRRWPDSLFLSIHDNGVGFDSGTAGSHKGLGLVSIRERIRLLNGTVDIISGIGEGAEIRVVVPFRTVSPESQEESKRAD